MGAGSSCQWMGGTYVRSLARDPSRPRVSPPPLGEPDPTSVAGNRGAVGDTR